MASYFHTIVDDRSSDGEEPSLLEKTVDPKTMAAFRTVGGKYCFQEALFCAKKISEVKKKYEGKLEYGNTTRKNSTNISTFVTVGLIIILLSSTFVEGVERGCSATSGTFTQTTDCSMADRVDLDGDLSITGEENTYTTLFAASNNRHFRITSGTPTLTLEWLNMTGGSPTSSHGGSIYINVEGHLNITHCVFYKNSAAGSSAIGGAIFANHNNVLISLTNTKFIKNSAGQAGGAVYLHGTLHSHHVQYIQNNADDEGGGLYLIYVKPSTINNNLFTMNKAEACTPHEQGMILRSEERSRQKS